MTGHSRFPTRPFEINEDPLIWDTQFGYVRGYIVALEDVLTDLSVMSYDRYTLDKVRERVQHTLDQANKTLETLESLRSEKEES